MEITGKRFGVVGLQRTGVAVVSALLERGAYILATDIKKPEQLSDDSKRFVNSSQNNSRIKFTFADDAYQGLDRCQTIVVSPGVPLEIGPLQVARRNGIEVIGEVELAYRLCPSPIIAITGTKGKTTVTTLIGEMLRSSGIPTVVAGNIGKPLIGELEGLTPDHRVVLEVSSFQLESTVLFRPHIAVLLNLHADHLDRHSSFEEYAAAKFKIFSNQDESDLAVINADLQESISWRGNTRARTQYFHSAACDETVSACINGECLLIKTESSMWTPLVRTDEIMIPGRHNVANVLAAALAASSAGANIEAIRKAAREFRGLPNRLELVAEILGIRFINDSQATVPIAAIAALNAFEDPIVLIAGGLAKIDDFDALGKAISERAHALVLIGKDASLIASAAAKYNFDKVSYAKSMDEAVDLAGQLCPSPGIVLLSPACASFDMFRDYEHRGELFRKAVDALLR